MDRNLKKLDAAKIAELKQYEAKTLDKEELAEIAGGNFGPSFCPRCGGDKIQEFTQRIEGGPDAGRLEVIVFCPQCGYEEWWGDY